MVKERLKEAAVSKVLIERYANRVAVWSAGEVCERVDTLGHRLCRSVAREHKTETPHVDKIEARSFKMKLDLGIRWPFFLANEHAACHTQMKEQVVGWKFE